jgi:hypothetical protein
MQTPTEQRQHPRLERNETVHIRVLLDAGRALETSTTDISAGGFRARLEAPLDAGTILHLVIEAGSPPLRFLLAAECRWCREESGALAAGFALLDARDSDYAAWQEFAGG